MSVNYHYLFFFYLGYSISLWFLLMVSRYSYHHSCLWSLRRVKITPWKSVRDFCKTIEISEIVYEISGKSFTPRVSSPDITLLLFLQIVLNATVGTSVRSDVAVDNIFVAPGKCVKNFPIHISICDFADMKNCKGLSGNGFNVVIDKSDGFTSKFHFMERNQALFKSLILSYYYIYV